MIKIRQIKIPILNDNLDHLKRKVAKILQVKEEKIKNIDIKKKSLDARDKQNIFYIYEVNVTLNKEQEILKKNKNPNILKAQVEKYIYPEKGAKKLKFRPVIVGSGPAGLFASFILASQGYKPLIIERGQMIEKRVKNVEEFWQNNKLKLDSNVQFGEGGAGTFSDGKLNTLTKDGSYRSKKVLETFVECGAPPEIMYLQNPHIGTDILRNVIINMRNKIIAMGGEFRYATKLTDIRTTFDTLTEIEVNNEEIIKTQTLILAIGHSARDTFEMLLKNKIKMEPKPFAVGIRIMHPQSMINEAQYGKMAPLLPPANYKLTYQTKSKRGVYSFCMCPGGYVVNASSEKNMLAINGMSNYKRDSKTANSAIVVTISPKDFGYNPLDGINYQRKLEKNAYLAGDGFIPIETWADYKKNIKNTKDIKNLDLLGQYKFSDLNPIFPSYINEALKEAIPYFGKKIKGFDNDKAILAAVESRTSSPIKIPRAEDFVANIKGIYPCGEGCGYAGGIMTSAIDGIKVAEAIIQKYYY